MSEVTLLNMRTVAELGTRAIQKFADCLKVSVTLVSTFCCLEILPGAGQAC